MASTGVPKRRLCRACFDGHYPVRLPSPEHRNKHLLEAVEQSEELMQGTDGGDPSPDEFDQVSV